MDSWEDEDFQPSLALPPKVAASWDDEEEQEEEVKSPIIYYTDSPAHAACSNGNTY
jgi:hypothetical protein